MKNAREITKFIFKRRGIFPVVSSLFYRFFTSSVDTRKFGQDKIQKCITVLWLLPAEFNLTAFAGDFLLFLFSIFYF